MPATTEEIFHTLNTKEEKEKMGEEDKEEDESKGMEETIGKGGKGGKRKRSFLLGSKYNYHLLSEADNFPFSFPFTYLTSLSLFNRKLLLTSLLCFPFG